IAALMGIGALLQPGDFGETSGRILLTTVVVGCASVITLCCLVVVGGRFQAVGVLGFLVASGTAALGLLLVWSESEDLIDNLVQPWGAPAPAPVPLPQVGRRPGLWSPRRSLAPLMTGTVVLAVVVASMVSALILEYEPSDGFLRTLGVVAILDVLGTLV